MFFLKPINSYFHFNCIGGKKPKNPFTLMYQPLKWLSLTEFLQICNEIIYYFKFSSITCFYIFCNHVIFWHINTVCWMVFGCCLVKFKSSYPNHHPMKYEHPDLNYQEIAMMKSYITWTFGDVQRWYRKVKLGNIFPSKDLEVHYSLW